MLVLGAKGFAKEILEVILENEVGALSFFDEVNFDTVSLFKKYRIIQNEEEALKFIRENDNRFCLGIGEPKHRRMFFERFFELGCDPVSIISKKSHIGSYNSVGEGVSIMQGSVITNDVTIGKGVLININATIGHESIIGEFSNLCPGVHISGGCVIGEGCFIGTGAVILPGIHIDDHSIVGAGAVITRNVEKGSMVCGIPGKPVVK